VHPLNDTALRPVELGASIFVSVNHVLQDAVKEFNLTPAEPYAKDTRTAIGTAEKLPFMGVYDGEKFVVRMEDSGWWSSAKLLWRYGLAPYYADKLMEKTVAKFLRIYEAPFFPFASLTKRVYDLELRETCASTAEQFFQENGISDAFAQEVIQAMTRVNYAQNLGSIHALEGVCSIATNGAIAVEGGNWRMFEAMVKASKAEARLGSEVETVERHEDGTITITSKAFGSGQRTDVQMTSEKFDTVILASPYQFANLDITPKPSIVPDTIPYVNLHVTLFTSPHYLAPTAFNLPDSTKPPRVILTTLQPTEDPGADPFYKSKVGFNSISLLGTRYNRRTGGDQYLYKIFSMSEIPDSFLAEILGVKTDQEGKVGDDDVSWVYRKLWQSYPYELPRVTFEELRLDQNLWYTSGIESFISTMETSALMGKNVAKLVVDEWVSTKDAYLQEASRQVPLQVEL
jgi:prenylcysteine oxidase/farnesylcysteine lyase